MSATTAKPTQARGFGCLPCPKCGEEATVTICLADLTDDAAAKCVECDNEFALADVQAFITKWQAVLTWVEQAPVVPE